MNKKDEALKLAIEALEYEGLGFCDAVKACIEALEQPEQEPVAWFPSNCIDLIDIINIVARREQDEQYDVPVYTHPATAQEPLSDDEIVKELERTDEYTGKSFFAGVRWAEQAHGIGTIC